MTAELEREFRRTQVDIAAKLESLTATVNEIRKDQHKAEAKFDQLYKTVINGGGVDSLMTRVRVSEEHEVHKAKEAKKDISSARFFWVTVFAGINSFAAAAGFIYLAFGGS